MNLLKEHFSVIVVAVLLLGGMVLLAQKGSPTLSGGNFIPAGPVGSATSSTSYSVFSSTRVLSTSTNSVDPNSSGPRVFATICNPNTTIVGLSLNNDRDVSGSSTTIFIGAAAGYDACYEIDSRYQGSVKASSTIGNV